MKHLGKRPSQPRHTASSLRPHYPRIMLNQSKYKGKQSLISMHTAVHYPISANQFTHGREQPSLSFHTAVRLHSYHPRIMSLNQSEYGEKQPPLYFHTAIMSIRAVYHSQHWGKRLSISFQTTVSLQSHHPKTRSSN